MSGDGRRDLLADVLQPRKTSLDTVLHQLYTVRAKLVFGTVEGCSIMSALRDMEFNPLVEVLRLLSAFLIVWFHSGISWGKELSYSGLIVFVLLTTYYSTISNKIGLRIYSRSLRFLVPWMFWSVTYGFGEVFLGNSFFRFNDNLFEQLLVGNYFHLWYLPFIYFILIILDVLRGLGNYRLIAGFVYLVSLMYFIFAEYWRPFSLGLTLPLPQYFQAIGAVFIGFYWGVFSRGGYGLWQMTGILILLCVILLHVNINGVGIPYAVGVVLVIAALIMRVEFKNIKKLKVLSDCAFGIYLIHPVFLHIVGSLRFDSVFVPILAFILSFLFIYFLRHFFPVYSRYVT